MKKRWIFTGVACLLGALFLWDVLLIGRQYPGFGFKALKNGGLGSARGGYYTYEYTWDPAEDEVTGLTVDWVYGPVEIVITNDPVIHITEKSNKELTADQKLKYTSAQDVLEISWGGVLTLLGRFSGLEKELKIEVPYSVAQQLEVLSCKNVSGDITVNDPQAITYFLAEEMEFSSSSGNLVLSGLSGETGSFSTLSGDAALQRISCAESAKISVHSGDLNMHNVSAKELTLETVSGSISAEKGWTDTLKVQSVSGPVEVGLTRWPAEVEMESVSGDLTLGIEVLTGDSFTVEYSSISGSFDMLGFPESSGKVGKSGKITVGKGRTQIAMTTTSGDMTILSLPGRMQAVGGFEEN